jgi:hypothetical protein
MEFGESSAHSPRGLALMGKFMRAGALFSSARAAHAKMKDGERAAVAFAMTTAERKSR